MLARSMETLLGLRPQAHQTVPPVAKKNQKNQTLNGRLPLEDSSDFDDSACVLIVMT